MILLQRPVRIFDVDAIGVAVLVALGVTAYVTAVVPSRAQAKQNQALSGEYDSIEQEVLNADSRLRGVERLTHELQSLVDERIANSPTQLEINAIVNDIMLEAENAKLQIISVEPRPPQETDGHYVCDVIMVGNGHAPSFVTFLETLSARHPYHAVEALSLNHGAESEDSTCRFELHMRLHLLPSDLRSAPEDQS